MLIAIGSASIVLRGGFENLVAATNEPPRAVLKVTDWDFGDVEPGQILRASFPVANAGGRRLVVVEESSNCSCSSTTSGGIVVPPGEIGELQITLNTDRLQSAIKTGLQFSTNDPKHPRLTLTLAAKVRDR
ncbi:MAG: DUF1573 domain-containing protein [Planctomycetaceae bacterium]|mgnify:FL=1|nr:DUF1573 domain-containing protein [Planctomycetaceae bacterium]MBT6156294.1 DUF1573 domain-containing protein [Planctomycetaceae bacterium]MBT6483481.1 DUF1573 domain-containing protein [Planctomycetaceae bacterium]